MRKDIQYIIDDWFKKKDHRFLREDLTVAAAKGNCADPLLQEIVVVAKEVLDE